jgi:NADH dehydrogenase FAD-containing subunit
MDFDMPLQGHCGGQRVVDGPVLLEIPMEEIDPRWRLIGPEVERIGDAGHAWRAVLLSIHRRAAHIARHRVRYASRASAQAPGVRPHALIIGAGYIGLEMADALTRRGFTVTLAQRGPSVLSTVDASLGRLVAQE